MEVLLTLSEGGSADLLRDLHAWLVDEPELRGRVRLQERAPDEGSLGPVTEALRLLLGGGGAATVVSVLIAWLQSRSGEVTVKLTRGADSIEVTAKGVKGLNPAALRQLTETISDRLGSVAAATDE